MADTRNSNTTHYHLGDFTRLVIAIADKSQKDALFVVRFLTVLVNNEHDKVRAYQPGVCRILNTLLNDIFNDKDQAILRMIIWDLTCNERRRLKEMLNNVGQNYVTSLHTHLTKSPPKDFVPSAIRSGGSTAFGLDIGDDEVLYLFLEEKKSRLINSIKQVAGQSTAEAKSIYKKYQFEYLDTLLWQIETIKIAEHVNFERVICLLNELWSGIDAMRSEYLDDCQPYIAYSMQCLNTLVDALGRLTPPLYSLEDLEQLLLKGINASKMKEYDPRDVYELSLLKLKMAKIKEKKQQSSAVVDYYQQALGHLGKCIQLVDESILVYSADLEDYARARKLDYLSVGVTLLKAKSGSDANYWSLIKFLLKEAEESYEKLTKGWQLYHKIDLATEKPFERADIKATLEEICAKQIDIIKVMLEVYIRVAFNDSGNKSMHFEYVTMCEKKINALANNIEAILVETVNDSDNNNNNSTTAHKRDLAGELGGLRIKFINKKFEHIEAILDTNDNDPLKQVNNLSIANVILTNHLRDVTLSGNQAWLDRKKKIMEKISELRTKAHQSLNQKKTQPKAQTPAFLDFLQTMSTPNANQSQQQKTQQTSEEKNNNKNMHS